MKDTENINPTQDEHQEKTSVWSQISDDTINMLGLGNFLKYPKVIKQVAFILFLITLTLSFIYNSHKAIKMVRDKDVLQAEIREIKWELTSIKSELLQNSMQSDIEKQIESIGLKSSKTPPYKIVVSKNEN